MLFYGLDIYDGTRSILQSQFIVPTGITFPVLMNASSVGFLYGVSTSNFMIIDRSGIVAYVERYYNERALKESLDTLTNAERNPAVSLPDNFKLEQNFPNPFNPSTKIYYEIKVKETTLVTLKIFDVIGNEVKSLVNARLGSGFFEATWDGTNDAGSPVPAGVYIYQLTAAGQSQTKRMLLLK